MSISKNEVSLEFMNLNSHIDNMAAILVVGSCAIIAALMMYRAWKQAGKRGCGGASCSCPAKIEERFVKKS